jgi:glycosyltransferase involved in cell wall biosynthesis
MGVANLFWAGGLVPLMVARALTKFFSGYRSHEPRLIFLAGPKGWENLEYIELEQSAKEYLGSDGVVSIHLTPEGYIRQVQRSLREHKPSHLFFDPRNGSQKFLKGYLESLAISVLLIFYRCVPIALLNNFPDVRWRRKVNLVTAGTGIIITLLNPRDIQAEFPFSRLIGPMPLALSSRRLNGLKPNWKDSSSSAVRPTIRFVGSLYEPRASLVEKAKREIEKTGASFEVFGRNLDEPKIDDKSYMDLLANCEFNFTTAEHEGPMLEGKRAVHLVYRYTEALAAGTILVAQTIPGMQKFLREGEHFVGYSRVENLAEEIRPYIEDKELRDRITNQARARVSEIVSSKFFWSSVDLALGKDGLV